MKALIKFAVLLSVVLHCQILRAQVVEDDSGDESAIRAASKAYVEAFRAKDAQALANFWSPDAVYTNRISGEEVVGRMAIAEQFAGLFKSAEKLNLNVDVLSIDFVSPNVAVEEGTAAYAIADEAPEKINYSAVYVRHDGKWLLDRVTDKPIPTIPSSYEHLKSLEWMIGSWIDDDDTAQVVTDCKWTKNRNFISRSFAVSFGDEISISGMQFIGWDPAAKQIRSWTFDSDGGFSQGTWTHSENRWIVKKVGTLHDGGKAVATNIIDEIDENSFGFRSIHRTVDGQLQPNIPKVRVVRVR